MARFESDVFGDTSGARMEYDRARERVVAAVRARRPSVETVRISSDAITLRSFMGGRWVNHSRGLSDGLDTVRTYQKTAKGMAHSWMINARV